MVEQVKKTVKGGTPILVYGYDVKNRIWRAMQVDENGRLVIDPSDLDTRYLKLDGSNEMEGDINPKTANTYRLGESGKEWYSVRSYYTDFSEVTAREKIKLATFYNDVVFQGWTGHAWVELAKVPKTAIPYLGISRAGSIIPVADASFDLGDASHRFRNIWGTNYIIGDNIIKTNRKLNLKPVVTPADPAEGDLYYDSTLHKAVLRTAAAWETITSV